MKQTNFLLEMTDVRMTAHFNAKVPFNFVIAETILILYRHPKALIFLLGVGCCILQPYWLHHYLMKISQLYYSINFESVSNVMCQIKIHFIKITTKSSFFHFFKVIENFGHRMKFRHLRQLSTT